MRIPGWVRSGTLTPAAGPERPLAAGELAAQRLELPLDEVDGTVIVLDMPPRWTVASAGGRHARLGAALERGPLVHCIEQVDLPGGVEVDDLLVPAGATASAREDGTLELSLRHRPSGGELYRSLDGQEASEAQ